MGPAADATFQQLKSAMTQTSVLALPNFDTHFVVKIDACATDGVGVVLMQ